MRLLSLVLFISSFLIAGCKPKRSKTEGFLENTLRSTYRVFEVNKGIVGAEAIEAAKGAWTPAARFSVYANGFKRIDYCLLIKPPFELDPGKAKFVKASIEKSCENFLFDKPVSAVKEFYNLFIELKSDQLKIKMDQNQFIYQFHNLKKSSLKISIPASPESSKEEILLKDGDVCLAVEDDCSQSEDLCSRCEGGSYYIKNSACESAYSKVCGQDDCGGKGEYACIRGHISTGVKKYCIQDSPVGFCHGKNRVACINKVLVCE